MKLCVGRQFLVLQECRLASAHKNAEWYAGTWHSFEDLYPGDRIVIVRVPSAAGLLRYEFDWGYFSGSLMDASGEAHWMPDFITHDETQGKVFVGGALVVLQALLQKKAIEQLPTYVFSPEMQAYIGEAAVACSTEQASSAVEPKNNDGREVCFACGAPTKRVNTGFSYFNICRKCGK